MEQELILITSRILEVGLWKFYLVSIGLLVVFVINILEKEKKFLNKLATISSGILFIITITLTLLARFGQ